MCALVRGVSAERSQSRRDDGRAGSRGRSLHSASLGAEDIACPGQGVPSPQAVSRPELANGRECAAASGIRDGSGPPAIDLQGLVANHRKRRTLRAWVVSVTEKVL